MFLRSLIALPWLLGKSGGLWPASRPPPSRAISADGAVGALARRTAARQADADELCRRDPRPHGLHAPARQAAGRYPRPADDRLDGGAGARANAGPVLVAAAEEEVAEAALKAGAQRDADRSRFAVRLGPRACGAGSVRSGAAAYDVAVNLQGDMPTMRAADVARAVAALRDGADIATLVSPSNDPADRDNPNVVKAIRAADGRCLAFHARSRAVGRWADRAPRRHLCLSPRCARALRRRAALAARAARKARAIARA